MSKPQLRVVDNQQLHARDVARQHVKTWRSDASKQRLPVANVHDTKGAPVLDVDEIVRRSYPNLTGKK